MTRALVLGGGGVAGAAWESGFLLGLLDAGIDLTVADRIIGTSAGSRVAAEVANGVPLQESFDRYAGPVSPDEISVDVDTDKLMAAFAAAISGSAPGPAMNRAIGRAALAADTVSEQVRRDLIASRLPVHTWPDRDVRITGVDVETGELRVFTPSSGVDLVDAVAASCAVPVVWPPVTIEGRRYIDGGIRSGTNTDLAAGCDIVIVIAPMPEAPWVGPDVAAAVAALESSATVVRVDPDEAAMAAVGLNPLDPASAKPAVIAGRAQAAAHAEEIAAIWSVE
jgi:NTE family protein